MHGVVAALVVSASLSLQAGPAAAAPGVPAGGAPQTGSRLAHLEGRAAEDGSVPVIVELDVAARPEHTLSDVQRDRQRATIRAARNGLVAELGAVPARLKTADEMPLLAFHATTRDIERLARSPRVVAVTEDRAHELAVESKGDPGVRARSPEEASRPGGGGEAAGTSNNGVDGSKIAEWWDYYQVGVDKARGANWTGSGQHVAVLDTGVDRHHGWINGRVVNETCFSALAHCPNGTTAQYGTGAAAPCRFHTDCAHGTHVAHTAAGHHGVASGARMLAVQVFSRNPQTGKPFYYDSDLVWGLSHVYQVRNAYRIAAVNMSLGGTLYNWYCDNTGSDTSVNATYLTNLVNNLKAVGIATVVASGNDNSATHMRNPACIANAVSVGNTTLNPSGYDAVYGYAYNGSNSNATLDLLAPGTDICSAVPTSFEAAGVNCNYVGTSMAAPHVAGAMAVLRQYRPSATVDALVTALRTSGVGVYDDRNGVNRSRINVWHALGRI